MLNYIINSIVKEWHLLNKKWVTANLRKYPNQFVHTKIFCSIYQKKFYYIMECQRIHSIGENLELKFDVNLPIPEPLEDEVLVNVGNVLLSWNDPWKITNSFQPEACGVCYRDILDRKGVYTRSIGKDFLPLISGHEFSGDTIIFTNSKLLWRYHCKSRISKQSMENWR